MRIEEAKISGDADKAWLIFVLEKARGNSASESRQRSDTPQSFAIASLIGLERFCHTLTDETHRGETSNAWSHIHIAHHNG